jgi:hypothetical protein
MPRANRHFVPGWHITHREDPVKKRQDPLEAITEDYREYSELIKPLSSTFCKKELSKNVSGFACMPFGLLTTSNTACTSGLSKRESLVLA